MTRPCHLVSRDKTTGLEVRGEDGRGGEEESERRERQTAASIMEKEKKRKERKREKPSALHQVGERVAEEVVGCVWSFDS